MLLVTMLVGVLAAYLRVLAGASPSTRAATLEDSLAQNTIHGLTNGCFERAAVAERLPGGDIADVVAGLSLKQCEFRCSSTLPPCGAFSFGVHSGGNTTCELGRTSSARINQHPDFDLYVRRPECDGEPPEAPSLHRPHRPPLGSQHGQQGQQPYGRPPHAGPRGPPPAPPPAPWGDLRAEHLGHVPFDNLDRPEAAAQHAQQQDQAPSPSQGLQAPQGHPQEGPPQGPPQGHLQQGQDVGGGEQAPPFSPDLWALPPGHNPLTKPALEFVCFRRVLAGGRLHEQLIRRSLPAEHIDRCRHACKVEDHFTCEGFNYRPGTGSCELTAVPLSLLEPSRDSRGDRDYDYYARDRNAQPPSCPGDDLYGPGPMWGPGWGSGSSGGGSSGGGYSGGGYSGGGYYGGGYSGGGGPPYRQGSPGWGGGNALGAGYAPGYASAYAPAGAEHGSEVGFYGASAAGGSSGAGTHRNDYGYQSNEVDYRQQGAIVKPNKHMYDGYGLLGGGGQTPGQYWSQGGGVYSGSYGGGYGGSYGGGYGYGYGYSDGGYPSTYITPPVPVPAVPAVPPPPPGAAPPPIGHPPVGDGCFVRAHGGFRMADRVLTATLATTSLPHCERECTASARCSAFVFRYNSWPYNCDLSDLPLPEVNTFTELVPDRNADVFGRMPRCAPPPTGWDHDAECFERVRSGQRLAPAAVKDLLHAPSLGACQTACLTATAYVCRAFTFRFGPAGPDGPPESCLLSDWPSEEILPWKDTLADPAAEMYQRSSFGRGCELWRRAWPGGPGSGGDAVRPTVRDQHCYVGYGGPARLLPAAVLRPLRVPTELDCKAECTRMFEAGDATCSALSFRSEDNAPGPNCLLSELAMRDLRPGLELARDPAHWLFAWNEDDPRCFRGHPRHPGPGGPRGRYPALPSRGADDDLWGREEEAGVWRRFSVSGQACRSLCAPHPVGFWSCALEAGGWDYCCRPGHACGYSEGYSYPWCYVGSAALDQWRPCSERYRPYPGGDNDARYWPVSYLHPSPPPNGTEPPPRRPSRPYPQRGGGGGSGGGYGGGSGASSGYSTPTSTSKPKDLVYPAVPRHRPGYAPAEVGGDDSGRWMPSVPNLPSRTSKFILDHPEYYGYVRLNGGGGGGGSSGNGTARHPPASGAGKDCQDTTSTSPSTSPTPPTSTAKSGNQSDVVVIGGDKGKKGDSGSAQVDDDDDFLSAAAAIVRTNTPVPATKGHRKDQLQSTTPRAQDADGDEDGDEDPIELEVVDAVDSAGTMASRNGTLTVAAKGSRRGQDDDDGGGEEAEESGRLERVALVERVDPKLGLPLAQAPRRAKITVFRRERSDTGVRAA